MGVEDSMQQNAAIFVETPPLRLRSKSSLPLRNLENKEQIHTYLAAYDMLQYDSTTN